MIMVNTKENSVIADSIFLQPFKVCGHVFKGMFQNIWIYGEPFNFADNPCGSRLVECLYIPVKFRGRIYSIHNSFLRSLRGLILPARWAFLALRIFSRNLGSLERRKFS